MTKKGQKFGLKWDIFRIVLKKYQRKNFGVPRNIIYKKALVLRPERNGAEWATGVRRSAIGRPFQAVGPATEKARRCRITVRERETSKFQTDTDAEWLIDIV